MKRIRRILIAIDFAPSAIAVVEEAVQLIDAFGASAEVFHVFEPPPAAVGSDVPVEAAAMTTATEQLLRLRRALSPELRDRLGYRFELGDARRKILDRVKEGEFDLIVMGSETHLAAPGESVAQTVIHSASCPVLLVPLRRSATKSPERPVGAPFFHHSGR